MEAPGDADDSAEAPLGAEELMVRAQSRPAITAAPACMQGGARGSPPFNDGGSGSSPAVVLGTHVAAPIVAA